MPKSPAAARTRAATARPLTKTQRPNLEESLARVRKERDHEGLDEAAEQYGSDLAAEIAAIHAGTHPIQERRRRAQR